jgi:hypothetical protein
LRNAGIYKRIFTAPNPRKTYSSPSRKYQVTNSTQHSPFQKPLLLPNKNPTKQRQQPKEENELKLPTTVLFDHDTLQSEENPVQKMKYHVVTMVGEEGEGTGADWVACTMTSTLICPLYLCYNTAQRRADEGECEGQTSFEEKIRDAAENLLQDIPDIQSSVSKMAIPNGHVQSDESRLRYTPTTIHKLSQFFFYFVSYIFLPLITTKLQRFQTAS